MAYVNRPFNFTGVLSNQIQNDLELANDNFDILAQVFVNNDPVTGIVKNADTLNGFHASQTPAPNTILPLNANGRIYEYVASGFLYLAPPSFTMSPDIEYFIGNVSITTPSWSPSGAWKVLFTLSSYFKNNAAGYNIFTQRIKVGNDIYDGASWSWYKPSAGYASAVLDTFILPELGNGVTQNYEFYVVQSWGTANAIFMSMKVMYYLIPA